MDAKEKMNYWKDLLGTTKLSNILAIIGIVISIISLWTANDVKKQVESNVEAERVGYVQSGKMIVNKGISVEDVDYIAEDNYKEMMDEAYEAENIIRIVNENPNLHFSLIWSGTEEEDKNTNWDEMPPHVIKLISGE